MNTLETTTFDRFWLVYPRRKGVNPKVPARKVFEAKVKSGVDPKDIIAGAGVCAYMERDKIGTPYIPHAVTWLRQERWRDYTEAEEAPLDPILKASMWTALLDREKRTGQWPSKQVHKSDIPLEFIKNWQETHL